MYAQCVRRNNDFLNTQRSVAVFGMKKEMLHEEIKKEDGSSTTIIDKIKKYDAIGRLEHSFRTGDLRKWYLLTDVTHHDIVMTFVDEEIPKLFNQIDKKIRNKLVMYPFITRPRQGNAKRRKEAVNMLAQPLQEEMKKDTIKDP